MMDDVDTAQLKLEGRCVQCKEKLLEHLATCEKNPRVKILKGVKNISYFLNTTLSSIAENADDPKKRRFLEEYLTKSKK